MSLQAVLCLLRAGIRECKANTKQTVARSKRRDPFRASAVGVWFFLLAASAIWLPAQTATLTTFASDPYDSFWNLIQASDGNMYAVTDVFGGNNTVLTGSASYSCPDGTANECDFITRIAPDGSVTILHTFERDATTGASAGFGCSSLIEAPNGLLYGTTNQGGTSGYGTIFSISVSGVFNTLYTFPADGSGSDPKAPSPGAPNGISPSSLILGSDGDFYGVSQGAAGGFGFFKISPDGTFTMLHAPDKAEYQDNFINPLIQAHDGNFYATTQNTIVQITPGGAVRTIYTFPADGSGGGGHGVLVEGADQNLYGTSEYSGYDAQGMEDGKGVLYKISNGGAYREFYRFSGGSDGFNVNSELTVGTDGNLYGTAYFGGNTLECNDSGPGCGTIFTANPATGFSELYKFSYSASDGQRPYGRMLQGADGNFIGSFNSDAPTNNSAFKLALTPALQAPIQLTFDTSLGTPSSPAKLTWKVLNAFSETMQQCHASILNSGTGASAGAGTWEGPLTGTMTGGVFTGSAVITPTANGTYTYVLNCGGIETRSVTLTVGDGPTITTASLPDGSVSKNYAVSLLATGGTQPYMWGYSGSLPPGMTLDSNSGILGGTPTQFGSYAVIIGVQDSAKPPQTNSATFPLNIQSSLTLLNSLNNATVGNSYSSPLIASGGFGTYHWALASGTLPNGIALNASTGVLSGTPTKDGKSTFSITVTDSEKPAAKVTQSFTLTTLAPPLSVEPGDFQDCTVSVFCDAQFVGLGGTPPYTWATAPGHTLPPGLTLSATGELSGTPTQSLDPPDKYLVNVQLTDSASPPVVVTGYNGLIVVSGLKITPFTLPVATVGVAYSSSPPVVTGGLPPYKWTVAPTDPSLNSDFFAHPDGSIYSKNPTKTGVFNLVYTAYDSEIATFVVFNTTLTIVAAPITTSTSLSSSSSTAGTGMTITLTAKVSESGSIPTGMVVFYSGTTALGTAPLDATGTASLTTTFSTAGTYNLTATYSGGPASTGSVSAPVVETVVTPSVTGSASPGTLTLTAGKSGTILITLTPAGGYTGTVSFSCGTLPAHVSCTFAPPSVTIAAGATSVTDTLTIDTAAMTSAALTRPDSAAGGSVVAVIGLWLPASMLALLGLRRKAAPLPRLLVLCLISIAGALAIAGCGSASPSVQAAPGTYSIPISLTLAGGTTQAVTATVIIQ